MNISKNGRYFRIDLQPRKYWRVWIYRMWYDGWHTAIHLGPVVISWGYE